jgi:two-component system, NarL family, sensor histidine kinase UhpB
MHPLLPPSMLPDSADMVLHLQANTELQRHALSRALHDELGGLMISAVMDLASAEKDTRLDDGGHERLVRARRTIGSAIDLERRMVETLRPTLLDNCGLFTALRWQMDRDCRRAGIQCTEVYPSKEIDLNPQASIALFRIVQDGMNVALRQQSIGTVGIVIAQDDAATLTVRIEHDGDAWREGPRATHDSFDICSMSHRVRGLGGELTVNESSAGKKLYTARIPLVSLLRVDGEEDIAEVCE